MSDTANQIIGEIISCDSLYIAAITADTDAAYTPGTPEPFAPVGEVKYDPKVSTASSSYDGIVMFNYLAEGISETTVTVSGLAEKLIAKITGKSYDPTTGIVYDSGDLSHTPSYALGYRVEIGTGAFKYFWLLKGKFYVSATDAKTKGEKIDPIATEVTFLPTRTVHKWAVPDPSDTTGTGKITIGQKRVIGDTNDSAFTGSAEWFTAVQVPPATV